MKITLRLALLMVFLICTKNELRAQELAPYPIEANGKQYEIRLGPEQRSLKTLSVYFVSPGNVSNAAMIDVSGPVGITGTAQGGLLGALDPAVAVSGGIVMQPYKMRTYPDRKESASFSMTSYYDPSSGFASAWFHLSKDACGPNSDRYIAQVKLDLSGIDPALYDQVFSIVISVRESKYQGKPVASIKPSSDGKYFGEPILLMNTVGYGDEYVNKVTWRNGQIVATKRLPVVKYVGYMGYGLSLIRIKSVLQGGRHTWELSNGGDIYGVCLQASRKRQRINGYPNSR